MFPKILLKMLISHFERSLGGEILISGLKGQSYRVNCEELTECAAPQQWLVRVRGPCVEISDTKKSSKALCAIYYIQQPRTQCISAIVGRGNLSGRQRETFLKALLLAVCSTAFIIFISCCSNQSTWSVSCFVMPNGEQ